MEVPFNELMVVCVEESVLVVELLFQVFDSLVSFRTVQAHVVKLHGELIELKGLVTRLHY